MAYDSYIRAMSPKGFFVTGIGTEVGKTVASAVLVRSLQANYWKPVQCGDLDYTDTHKIQEWAKHEHLHCFPERYALQMPASPHIAAATEKVDISLDDFSLPESDKPLIVEGAGGLLVPLNDKDTMLDLIASLKLPVILVSRHYLGSINHSLMSFECLRQRNIPIHGILFNGNEHPSTESIIEKMTDVPILGRIGEMDKVDAETIQHWSEKLKKQFA
ncbi:MAG: dethiobiotin synthase [Bacteroidota bacterium]